MTHNNMRDFSEERTMLWGDPADFTDPSTTEKKMKMILRKEEKYMCDGRISRKK